MKKSNVEGAWGWGQEVGILHPAFKKTCGGLKWVKISIVQFEYLQRLELQPGPHFDDAKITMANV